MASIHSKYAGFLEWLLDLAKRCENPGSAVAADTRAGYRRCFDSFLASWERTGTALETKLQTEVFAKVTFLIAFAAAVEAHVAMAGACSRGEYAPCETPAEEHDLMRVFLAGAEAEWLLNEQESLFHKRKRSRIGAHGRWMPQSHVFSTGRTYCRSWFVLLART